MPPQPRLYRWEEEASLSSLKSNNQMWRWKVERQLEEPFKGQCRNHLNFMDQDIEQTHAPFRETCCQLYRAIQECCFTSYQVTLARWLLQHTWPAYIPDKRRMQKDQSVSGKCHYHSKKIPKLDAQIMRSVLVSESLFLSSSMTFISCHSHFIMLLYWWQRLGNINSLIILHFLNMKLPWVPFLRVWGFCTVS